MIKQLDNVNTELANQIFCVFQRSYKVEAQLIGVDDFPPLQRSARQIQKSKTLFYGYSVDTRLAAVIEIVLEAKHLEIHSLTVDPDYFRKGIASRLLKHVLTNFDFSEAIVETAVVNTPAIDLYK